jgi:2-hydroxychromene-2-carboxylate isomerase
MITIHMRRVGLVRLNKPIQALRLRDFRSVPVSFVGLLFVSVDFYFDVMSSASYLAYTQLPEIARRTGAKIVWKPMLLGAVLQATGNQGPARVKAKARWMEADMHRWAQRYGVPFQRNPDFPINSMTLMRGAVGMLAAGEAEFLRYVDCVMKAMWEKGMNLSIREQLVVVLEAAGFDMERFDRMVADPGVKAALKQYSDEAVERGAFGAPTFYVGDEMFWGQDRLDFVEEALRKSSCAIL